MSITEISIKRPLLITVIFVTLILFGFISYNQLNYNLLPKFEASVISVTTIYRGASADEVESSVTKPIEDMISSIEGVDHITSTSREGVSSIIVQLKPGISTIRAQQDGERKINRILSSLPENAETPFINRFSSDELPVLRISASSNKTPSEMYDLIDQQVKPVLANVYGVGNVNLIGGNRREIQVMLDQDKLNAYKISPSQVAQVIGAANVSYPVGNVESKTSRFSIRLDEKIRRVDDFRNLVVSVTPSGSRILLRDIATVSDGITEDQTVNRINGKPGIGIEINKQADANAVKVSKLVKQKLAELEKQYSAQGLHFEIASDQSDYTLASADAVMHDLVLAVFIVAAVMLLFLHSIRSSMFVLVSLPSAMIPTFILMYAFGFSLNLMTLMALSLVVGILVDDSIVILENIFRHMEMGKDRKTAAVEGRKEIGFTAVAITLVDVVVFVPMALAGGMIGNILREFSLVVVFSTLMSLFVSFTITPLLASRFARLEHLTKGTLHGRFFLWFEKMIDTIRDEYARMLRWVLRHKLVLLGSILVLFVGAIALIPAGFIGTAFVANSDRGELNIGLEMSPETPLYEMNQKVLEAERIVMSHPEVVKVFSNVGTQSGNSLTGNTNTSNIAELSVKMVDKKERKIGVEEFGIQMRDEISQIPGLKVTIKAVGITGNSDAPIQIAIKGTDMDKIWETAKIVFDAVQQTPGTDYVEYSTKTPQKEIAVDIDRDKLSLVGLSIPEVGNAMQVSFRGNDQLSFTENGEEYTINIIGDKADRQDIESVKNIPIRNSRGATIRLGDIAHIHEEMGQSVLQRSDRLSSIQVRAFTVGRPTGTIVADIQKKLEQEKLPEGVTLDFQGQAQQQKDAFGSLGMAMLIGFLLVYLIMVALYESAVYPFVVMFSIPVALIGALLALALSMESLTIFAIVGLIMLMGLVAKNGILIVDFANHLKEQGMSKTEALVEAGKERLRPILMTTVAMILGMLPIALSAGSGAEVKNGMGWVIIGGLTSSLVLTLFLVPTMYYIVDSVKDWVGRIFRRKSKTETVTSAQS